MAITDEQVRTTLSNIIDPHLDADIVTTDAVKAIEIDAANVSIHIELGYPAAGWKAALSQQITDAVGALDGVDNVSVDVGWSIDSHAVQKNLKPLDGIKNIIAVASGKGGVGKSTTAVNLALALQVEGATVGILDADVYGPSQPRMLGVSGQPNSPDGKSLSPMIGHGIQSMSIGYLVDEETPMIWRGPMVTQALQQLLGDTMWSDVDYLVIDLPPGTGDTQLTLAQQVPVSGAVIVTTPQDIALIDAIKGLKMFEKVEVPVLGVVENMSMHICSECGHAEPIFGTGGGERMATDNEVELLGQLPLDINIRVDADSGNPTVAADPDSTASLIYRDIARKVTAKLSAQTKDYSAKFPSIQILDT